MVPVVAEAAFYSRSGVLHGGREADAQAQRLRNRIWVA